jgi:hypothetical protein
VTLKVLTEGLKKNLPKKVKRETKKPEGQQIAEAAKRAGP